jgi:hypothetical protein
MSGDRKRFLRKGDTIINLDCVGEIRYDGDRSKLFVFFPDGEGDCTVLPNVTRAEFERLVSELKCGEGRE